MDDNSEDQSPSEQWRLATMADFEAVDFEAPVGECHFADAHDMYGQYAHAFGAAREAADERAQVVYRFLGHVCGMMLRPADAAVVWQPVLPMSDGSRSAVAEDYRGEQTALLRTLAPRIKTIALRARCYDIAWFNERRDGASAAAAVDAYCGIVDGVLNGILTSRYGVAPGMLAKTPMHRALQIAWLTTKRTSRPQRLRDTFARLYGAVQSQGEVGILLHLARLAIEFDLKDRLVLASDLEACANAVPLGKYSLAVKAAYDLASDLLHKKDPAARQRCLLGAVRHTLAMRDQVSTPGAEAHWVMEALQQLRHVTGQEALVSTLEAELRRLQKASLSEMGTFEIDLKVDDTAATVTARFEGFDRSDALREFALLAASRDPARLKVEALEAAKATPLMSLAPMSFVDGEGRTVKIAPGLPHEGEPDPLWFTFKIDQAESFRRGGAVASVIDPARLAIQAKFGLIQDDFAPILAASAFVSESQGYILALGFARLFQGDLISAAHLVIPQLEPCLRHILKINGNDPSRRAEDSSEQDLSLATIYSRFRGELERILTPAVAWEIDRLFNQRPGPALRHEVAHGQLSAGDCYHPNVYYAVWLIYRVCCLFALPVWDGVVAPVLRYDVNN